MAEPLRIDPRLLDYCETDRQRELITSIIEAGGVKAASVKMGVGERSAFECLARIRKQAGLKGFCPEAVVNRPTIPGFTLDRVSTLTRNEAGEPQWQIQQPDKAAQAQALKEFVRGLCDDITPTAPTASPETPKDSDLLAAIVLGDPHFGLYTYSPETRNRDWDTDIAGKDTRAAMDDLIDRSPNAETGVLVNVGDAMHMDSSHNTTFAGTPVDADTRYHRVMRSLAMTLRYGVNQMLKKYGKVVVVCARGNHDPDSAIAIQLMLEFYYENEPRVTVLPTQGFFHHIEFGRWLIGVHHGDKVKAQKLVNIMARDLPEAWGRTENRIWLVGHEHHQETIELDGCKVRKFGTLAPSDGWHASKGYAGESTMELLVFRRGGGMHSTLIYNIPKHKVKPDCVV